MEPTPLQTRLWSLGNLLTSLDLGTGLRTLFFLALPLWMLSCGSSAQATPVPISSPMPTPSPREVLQQSSERMLSLDTAHFVLEHEAGGSSVLFPGVDILRIEGRVDMPDRFSIEVEAMSRFPRSFIPINLVAVVGQARMTDFLNTDKWNDVPLDSLPFDFGDLGRTLGDIIAAVEDPVFETSEKVDGVLSWSVVGDRSFGKYGQPAVRARRWLQGPPGAVDRPGARPPEEGPDSGPDLLYGPAGPSARTYHPQLRRATGDIAAAVAVKGAA